MPLQDLTLTEFSGQYSLSPPTEDLRTRAATRFIILFLSSVRDERGSLLVDAIAGGQVKTNADIGLAFAFAASDVLEQMRELALEITPTSVQLLSFSFPQPDRLRLRTLIQTITGDIIANIEVTTP